MGDNSHQPNGRRDTNASIDPITEAQVQAALSTVLTQGGHYAELYTTYFRRQSMDYQPWEEPV